ncbi:uncharacterized protein FIESC28_02350 [Fusarium coffeatum]|uniref:Methyltransferase domain-containing protein n=1 Tax=Fusarium coffeatum TaxID=231269 RepID=A0A366S839_9HYPO|nr:uncharacterized protein FIESC28_02350 [Fusarium coffeatum]RBR24860.1 hypothetical protein FIESC28_02350 [Fusarium coffeatum]
MSSLTAHDQAARQVSPKSTSASPRHPGSPHGETGLLPPEHWAALPEEDNDRGDAESTISDNASSTGSLSSSILEYRTIHGRSYHSDRGNADYWGPTDETSQEAMDINHQVLTLLMGDKLYLAPISENIQAAVDIGTGTGIWAIEFADMFPHASVVGTDLAPIQPSWVPPNLEFQIDDCTQEWTFQPESLDYVHIRWMLGSIMDWTALFQQAYRALKPGGYIESFEPSSCFESDDGTVVEGGPLDQWGRFFREGGRKIGRPFTVYEDSIQEEAMRQAGFVEIEERVFKARQYTQAAINQDAKGSVMQMATLLGWTEPEVTVFVSHLRREISSPKIHSYFKQKVVWSRKPEAAQAD